MFVSGTVPDNLVITSKSKLEKRILQIISRPKAAGVIRHIDLSGVKINELFPAQNYVKIEGKSPILDEKKIYKIK